MTSVGPLDLSALEKDEFDVIQWINEEVRKKSSKGPASDGIGVVPFAFGTSGSSDSVENTLHEFNTDLELAIADMSDQVEVLNDQILDNVPTLQSDLGPMKADTNTCKSRLERLLKELAKLDTNQQESLSFLSQIDLIKGKLETCRDVLLEIQQWEVRAREIEGILANAKEFSRSIQTHPKHSLDEGMTSGSNGETSLASINARANAFNLSQALTHLNAMKSTCSALSLVPDYNKKASHLKRLEAELIAVARWMATESVIHNNTFLMQQSSEVFIRMGRHEELFEVIKQTFRDQVYQTLWTSAWTLTSFHALQQEMSKGDTIPESRNLIRRIREDEALLQYHEHLSAALHERSKILVIASQSAQSAVPQLRSGSIETNKFPGRNLAARGSLPFEHQTDRSFDAHMDDKTMLSRRGSSSALTSGQNPELQYSSSRFMEILIRCVKAGVELPNADIRRLIFSLPDFPEAVKVCDRLLRAYDTCINLVCAIPAVAQCDSTGTDSSLWQKICDSVDFLPPEFFDAFSNCMRKELGSQQLTSFLPQKSTFDISQKIRDLESNSMKVLASLRNFGSHLEETSACLLAPAIITSVDHYLDTYFREWIKLIKQIKIVISSKVETLFDYSPHDKVSHHDGFTRSMHAPGQSVAPISIGPIPLDTALLTNCLQFSSLIRSKAHRIQTFGCTLWRRAAAIWHKSSRYNVYLRVYGERHQITTTIGQKSETFELLKACTDHGEPIPSTPFIFQNAWKVVHELQSAGATLASHCVTYPVVLALMDYADMSVWIGGGITEFGGRSKPEAAAATRSAALGDLLSIIANKKTAESPAGGATTLHPSSYVTSIGEHLFSLVPHLDACELESLSPKDSYEQDSEDGATAKNATTSAEYLHASAEILPKILDDLQDIYISHVQKIRSLSRQGLSQLSCDVGYVSRAMKSLGGDVSKVDDLAVAIASCLLSLGPHWATVSSETEIAEIMAKKNEEQVRQFEELLNSKFCQDGSSKPDGE